MFSVADTGQLAYSSTARAPSELTWMDPHGRVLGTVGRPGVFFNLDLSPDEQRVAISQCDVAAKRQIRLRYLAD